MDIQLTDKERLLELLKSFNITPELQDDDVTLTAGVGNVEGYSYFFCKFKFDENGTFQLVGIWE